MSIDRVSYERLIAFAADELNTDEARPVRLHLYDCARCTTTVQCFDLVRATLRTDDSQLPPPATLARAYELFAYERLAARRRWLGLN